MVPFLPEAATHGLPIDGIDWSWRALTADDLDVQLPFVMATDPSGTEALHWRRDARNWLGSQEVPRGIVAVHCRAGLTLALFFFAAEHQPDGRRRLAVERLRWLELARPHRSLDALLRVLVESGHLYACDEVVILPHATTEHRARAALDARAELAGFRGSESGWTHVRQRLEIDSRHGKI